MYQLPGMKSGEWVKADNVFGSPSDHLYHTRIDSHEVFFLPRHARGHLLLPSELNHPANIFALKSLGTDCVLSLTAVGSLREALRPGDLCIIDQYFDRTKNSSRHTFFGDGVVGHVPFGDPICPFLRAHVVACAEEVAASDPEITVHDGGTYVNMEGPAFSTRAESTFYQKAGFDVVGMTSLAEAKLCREAELPYSAISVVTDYDCWHEDEQHVSADLVTENMKKSLEMARKILMHTLETLPEFPEDLPSRNALKGAIMTDPAHLSDVVAENLRPIIGRYL